MTAVYSWLVSFFVKEGKMDGTEYDKDKFAPLHPVE
jgi:hypothetical protein